MKMKECDLERFVEKIECGPEIDSCWEWIAGKNNKGYGTFSVGGNMFLSHRVSYMLYNGNIPKSLQIDHLCRNHSCVNPDHLEAVSGKENCRRGLTGKINNHNKKKTHCKNGHEFNNINTRIRKNGSRFCRVCDCINHRTIYLNQKDV